MAVNLAATQGESFIGDWTEVEPTYNVKSSYDGSNVVYRLLRMETWGPSLMNLGFHRFRGSLAWLNFGSNFELAQRRLVIKAVNLLNVTRGDRILDIACGRGKSSFILSCMHQDATIVGLDYLEGNVQVAETLFDQVENLSYVCGDAMSLDFPDESFDQILCVEAAFHFPDRGRFLREAYRVLAPGGRLVVVDFAWTNDAQRIHRNDPETRLVREIWQWDDMFSITDYTKVPQDIGFRTLSSHDWTESVTVPIQCSFQILSALGNHRWGRKLLERRNPLFRSFSTQDWKDVAQAVKAHGHANRFMRYMAFAFEKQ